MNQIQGRGQAGTQDQENIQASEIEITPAMIEAGRLALIDILGFPDFTQDYREAAEHTFRKMACILSKQV